jgi:hypothetical protein
MKSEAWTQQAITQDNNINEVYKLEHEQKHDYSNIKTIILIFFDKWYGANDKTLINFDVKILYNQDGIWTLLWYILAVHIYSDFSKKSIQLKSISLY